VSPLYCKVCRQIVPDLRFGVCFDCAEAAQESRERLERIESVQAPKIEEEEMKLDIEQISAAVHEKWMETKRANGVTSRKSESGEELMVPYEQLSEKAKDLDRGSVKAVVEAIESLNQN
jgi:hypothetical protein